LEFPHRPVMVREALEHLLTDPAGVYVDGTAGSGGHSEAIGRKLSEGGRLICLDRDPEAIRITAGRLSFLGKRVDIVKANFSELGDILAARGIETVNGVFLDLGMSTYQLDHSGRGFSFSRDEPLDMRMDPEEGRRASDLLNNLPEKDLESILRKYGEEKRAKAVARAVARRRKKKGSTPPGNSRIS